MKHRNYRALALILSASIASQPVSVSAQTIKSVLSPNQAATEAQDVTSIDILDKNGMSDNNKEDIEYVSENSANDSVESEIINANNQVRNGKVKYDDQKGKITAAIKKTTIQVGELKQLSFTGADTQDISFVSSKPSVVQVDTDGNVYGVRSGSATITAWYNGKKAKTRVKVAVPKEKGSINVKEIYTGNGLNPVTPKITGVESSKINMSAEDVSITAQDYNDNTFSVNKKVITYDTEYGKVTVDSFEENPQAVNQTVTIGLGETKTLITNGITEGIIWYSKKSKIAKVDSLGRVTGVKKGTAKIIAKVGKKKLTYTVTVDALKTPDVDNKNVVTQVRLTPFSSVNLSEGGHIISKIKTGSYDGQRDPHSKTLTEQCFTYRVINSMDGSEDTIEITGLTDAGKAAAQLVIPAYIDGKKVKIINTSFDNADVYFDKDIDVSAIPSTISEKTYTIGDFTYRYVVKDGKMVVETTGLSEQGKEKS